MGAEVHRKPGVNILNNQGSGRGEGGQGLDFFCSRCDVNKGFLCNVCCCAPSQQFLRRSFDQTPSQLLEKL